MAKRLILVLAALGLEACGHAGFYRDDKPDYKTFYTDLRACEAEATPQWSFCTGMGCQAQSNEQVRIRNNCMKYRGWYITRKEPKFVP